MKTCLACLAEFEPSKYDSGKQRFCSDCSDKAPARHVIRLEKEYGISIAEYREMLQMQDGRCGLCGADSPGKQTGTDKKMYVDHDHQSGKVRGLLCSRCNVGLGMFRDDPELMRRAAEYIEKARQDGQL
jgi:hypothetical protein